MKIFNSFRRKRINTESEKKKRKIKVLLSVVRNIRIAPKLVTGFLIISVMSAAMGTYASLSLHKVGQDSRKMYDNIMMPYKCAVNVLENFNNGTEALRQILISDNDSVTAYTNTIKNCQKNIDMNLNNAGSLIIGEKQLLSLEKINDSYDNYKTFLSSAVLRIEAGDKQSVIDDYNNSGDLYMAEKDVVSNINTLARIITDDAMTAAQGNESTANTVLLITMISGLTVLVLSVIIGTAISKNISRPINKLTSNFKQLSYGETEINIAVETADEIGQMNEAFKTILQVCRDLEKDTGVLIDAATEGDLSVRVNTEKHHGIFKRIVAGINATLDAMISPINESACVLGELAAGNLNICMAGDYKGDFKTIKDALNNTIEALKSYIGEISSVMGEMSKGVLSGSIKSEFKGDFLELKDSINKSIDSFGNIILKINVAARQMAAVARQLLDGSHTISQAAAEQAASINQFSVSIEQITAQIKQNADNSDRANRLVYSAKTEAEAGNERMKAMQDAMNQINESSKNISKIIKVINNIAYQTNILAINAAVEASKSGAYGKGFAVVAQEVKNLSGQSENAAKEIAVLIEESIRKAETGTAIANETADALNCIISGIDMTSQLVNEISIASNEQAAGISQISNSVLQFSHAVQLNTATSKEVAATGEDLSKQANELEEMISHFVLRADEGAEQVSQT